MKLNDDILRFAATMLRDEKMNALPHEKECPVHTFSDEFEQEMQELIEKVKRGEIRQKRVALGWQYYTRNGLAAVLLCFILTFLAAPEVVLAGYHKLVEIIETVFEDYTEFRYETNESIDTELKKVSFGYLPDTLDECESSLNERLYYVLYQGEDLYFCMEQRKLSEESEMTQIVDTENAVVTMAEKIIEAGIEDKCYDDFLSFGWYDNPRITNLINLTALSELIYFIKSQFDISNQEIIYVHDHIDEFEDTIHVELQNHGINIEFADSKNEAMLQIVDNAVSILRHAYDKGISHIKSKEIWKYTEELINDNVEKGNILDT